MADGGDEASYGSTFDDLAEFIKRPEPGGYPIQEVRECMCRACGGRRFEIEVMATSGGARRVCLDCRTAEYIADSEEYWEDDPEATYCCGCTCRSEDFAAAVGYSVHEEEGDIRWIYVGLRCLACGRMAIYEDWKVNYGPSAHLLDRA